jgi:peptide/nickel transport system substrate-binding protein
MRSEGTVKRVGTRSVAVLAAVVTVSALAACNGSGSAAGSDTKAQIVVGQVAEPKSLDPAADTAVNDFRILVNVYDGLVSYAPDSLDLKPGLAKSWKVSDGGKTYTFALRHGVKFQDGTPFNAKAVKYNFDRMLVKGAPGSDTGPFPLAKQFFGEVKDVSVVDDYTVKFTLKEPYAPFLANLAYPTGLIVSPAAVKKYGKSFGHHPVGTGAFKFQSWEANQNVTLQANPDYWNGKPPTKTLVFRPLPDASSRISALRSGGADIVVEVPPDNVKQLKSTSGIKVQSEAGPAVWFLILNTKSGPFKSKLVRQAANYAVDKKAIVDNVLQGTATVAKGPIAPAFGKAYDKSLTGYPFDLQKAKELMAEAGYAKGVNVTFYVTSSGSGMLEPKAMGEAIQAQLEKVGIHAQIKTFEWNTYLDKVNAGLEGKADMAEMAWMTNDPGTLPYLTLRTEAFPKKQGFNSGYYSNPKVDKLINQAQVTADPAKRDALFKKMQAIVVEDAPWLFVANGALTAAMTDHLHGFHLHPSFDLYFHKAYIK